MWERVEKKSKTSFSYVYLNKLNYSEINPTTNTYQFVDDINFTILEKEIEDLLKGKRIHSKIKIMDSNQNIIYTSLPKERLSMIYSCLEELSYDAEFIVKYQNKKYKWKQIEYEIWVLPCLLFILFSFYLFLPNGHIYAILGYCFMFILFQL